MTRSIVALGCAWLGLVLLPPILAQEAGERPALPDFDFTQEELAAGLAQGKPTIARARHMGFQVFTTPFNALDGYGDGPFDPAEEPPFAFGHRPTLQGNGLALRVNGLDAQSCQECHSIVSHRTRPVTLGFGGVGGVVTNAIIGPTLIDVADSFDDRVGWLPGHDPDLSLAADGIADYNGRFANPPFLFGGGGVELLGKEMTADLQALLEVARKSRPGVVTQLETHGVSFGTITTLDSKGNVELDLEGVGPIDPNSVPPEEALVVRPFGRKGENFSMRDFDRGAMQFHFGIQPVEVFGEDVDEDGDGVMNEVPVVAMSLLHIFDVQNEPPRIVGFEGPAKQGFQTFMEVDCASCHIPIMQTRSRFIPLSHPEVPHDPAANVYVEIDLTKVGFEAVENGEGVLVPLFADLKRHDMGPELAESFHLEGEVSIPNSHFTTARLWGVADTAPYLHDGRATTLFDAIEMHGGEAQTARDNFMALSSREQEALIRFLLTLRTPEEPNRLVARPAP